MHKTITLTSTNNLEYHLQVAEAESNSGFISNS